VGILGEKVHHGFGALWSAGSELSRGGPPFGFLQRCGYASRLVAAALMITAAIFTHSMALLVAIYIACAVAALLSFIQIGRYLMHNLVIVGAFALPLALFGTLRFVTPGEVALSLGPVEFTSQGIRSAAFVTLRALVAVSVTMLLVRSAGISGVLRGLGDLRVPDSLIAALQIAIAHIHVLGRTAYAMALAHRARLVKVLPVRAAYRTIATQGAVLMYKSVQTSRLVHAAMLARGFDGSFPQLHARGPLTWRDGLILLVASSLLVAAVIT
jgi:cobalt/nickel transport system permease protein